jgi:hypothetical protein
MTIESLKGLDLLGNATPLPATVKTYLEDNVAQGSGVCGTYLITDFFGTAAGLPGNVLVANADSFIRDNITSSSMTDLKSVFDEMRAVVDGTPPFSISIAGTPLPGSPFADYDSALAALVIRANQAVGAVIGALPDAVTVAADWTALAQHFFTEVRAQGKAGIDWAAIPNNLELPTTVFVVSLDTYGQDTTEGGAAQFLESVANTAVQAGQALVGAMREGRNNEALDAESIKHDNVIPEAPSTALPQATLSNAEYTVAEARALAGG